jgi:hypothetical protein
MGTGCPARILVSFPIQIAAGGVTVTTAAACFLICAVAQAQTADSTLIVVGSSYRFSIPLPKGWSADMIHAKEFQADVILYKDSIGQGKDKPVIKVACFKKDSLNPSMEFRPKNYSGSQRLRDLQKQDDIHKEYTYIRAILEDEKTKEPIFITYINPSLSYDYLFSVIMEHDNTARSVTDKLAVEAFLTALE